MHQQPPLSRSRWTLSLFMDPDCRPPLILYSCLLEAYGNEAPHAQLFRPLPKITICKGFSHSFDPKTCWCLLFWHSLSSCETPEPTPSLLISNHPHRLWRAAECPTVQFLHQPLCLSVSLRLVPNETGSQVHAVRIPPEPQTRCSHRGRLARLGRFARCACAVRMLCPHF